MSSLIIANVLRGTDNDIRTSTYKNVYSLDASSGKCTFLPHTALALPSERAFLTMSSAVEALTVEIDNTVDAIKNVSSGITSTSPAATFDLQGRRVSTLRKGVYIQDGRKVVGK